MKTTLRFTLFLAILVIASGTLSAQQGKGSGGGGTGSSGGGSAGGTGGGGGGQGSSSTAAPPAGSSSAGSASRIETTMLAFEASDKIAEAIAKQIDGGTVFVYDSTSSANLQTYDTYAETVDLFGM